MMNCKEATRLMSDARERPLTFAERASLRFHTMMCKGCRNFDEQMDSLRYIARSWAKGDEDESQARPEESKERKSDN